MNDAPAAVGRQVAVGALPNPGDDLPAPLAEFLDLARSNRIELIASSQAGIRNAGFEGLLALSSDAAPVTFTAVQVGTSYRLGPDRDDDGIADETELAQGSDPLDVRSPSPLPLPVGDVPGWVISFTAHPGQTLDEPLDRWYLLRHPNRRIVYSFLDPAGLPPGISIDPSGNLWPQQNANDGVWIGITDTLQRASVTLANLGWAALPFAAFVL